MATILFAWELGAGLNHLVNQRPLAAGLIERGHKVVMALRDLSRARLIIPDKAAMIFQAPGKMQGGDPAAEPNTFAQILAHVAFGQLDELSALVEAWRNLYDVVRPDAIVFDHSPSALLAARGVPTRRVLLGTGFFCPTDQTPPYNLRPWDPPDPAKVAQDEAHVLDRINSVLADWRQPPIERVTQLYNSVDENFITSFRELDPYPDRKDTTYRGALTDAGGEAVDWPSGGGPRIFAYLKPFPALPQLFEAFVKLDCRVLACVDGFGPQLREHFASPRIKLFDKPVDLVQVAAECDAAVLNGNHGTSVAMLLAGKPTLQIPIFLEQALTMQAIVRQGCGLGAAPTGVNPIGERLEMLLVETRFKNAAEQFAHRYAGWDMRAQVTAMLDRIEQLAR